jgi:microcystin-dependent protein
MSLRSRSARSSLPTTYSRSYNLRDAVRRHRHGLRRTGDGSTTFNVPDFRGRTIIGAGTGAGLTARARGDKSGEETHVILPGELAAHAHDLPSVAPGCSTGWQAENADFSPSGSEVQVTPNGTLTP